MNKIILILFLSAFFVFNISSIEAQIKISTQYHGYWEYNGQPTLLIGGWNHGHNPFLDHNTMDDTVVSTKSQIISSLEELAEAGGNLLRCVLDPGAGAGKQGFNFCEKAGSAYNLDKMEGSYWDRLDWFLEETQKREIIVGIEIWDRFDWYSDNWSNSPFNPKNNLNYTFETSGLEESYQLKGGSPKNPFGNGTSGQTVYEEADSKRKSQFDLVRKFQEKFVDKLLSITFKYDNILYSANNEVRFQEPVWGQYWIAYIKRAAEKKGKTVICTDMFWDLLDLPGPCNFDYMLANKDVYEYFDISQTSLQRNPTDSSRELGRKHWNMVSYAVQEAKKVNRLLHMNKIYGSQTLMDSYANIQKGNDDNAIEEFWRSLIAGVAGVRFHRPDYGIGLSEKSKNSMIAVRLIEKTVKFWEIAPHQELLSSLDVDEAYLAAKPGESYLLFFTDGGSVELNLSHYKKSKCVLTWINVDEGKFHQSQSMNGGKIIKIDTPANGHWVAIIVPEE